MLSFFKKTLKPLSRQIMVITGASSGIGLATAFAAARKGARLVLVARNETALADAKRKIDDMGGECVYVVADVSKKEEIQKIVQGAIDAYGGFDTWVNNAGVSIIGRMENVSEDDHKRLFDTNFWGQVHGSLAASRHLKDKGGAIINVGSLLSDMSVPLQGMYCASKHAVKGFTDSLRHEIEAEKSPVSVTLIKPAAIATPFFSHAKNYTMQEPKAPQPVYTPEDVAYAILHAAENAVRDIRVGGAGAAMAAMNAHMPRVMDWLNAKTIDTAQLSDKPKSRTKSNLHEFGIDGAVRGKDMPYAMNSLYTRAVLNPLATSLAMTTIGLAAYALMGRKGGSKLGKAALTGFNLAMPLQNAALAGKLLSYLEKKYDKVSHSLRDDIKSNAKSINNAVNENAKLVKQKTIKLLK